MNIRKAVIEDIDAAIDLLNEFKEESLAEYGMDLDLETIRQTCEKYIGSTLVAEENGKIIGIIAGTLMRLPTFTTPIYLESVWYVSKAHRRVGIHLLRTLEELCKSQGISHLIMAHMMNSKTDKLGEFYRRQGFIPYEINYIKKLEGGKNESALA
jgi:N-acetylglutamate synthase-like GNAT family acetyltransferase